jgi:tetratricopeptide (TPR) repeat protein
MKSSGPPPSRLLLRLALALEGYESLFPARWRTASGGGAGLPESLPEPVWKRLKSLTTRFQAELAFADARLDDDPPRSRIRMLLANSSEMRRVAILLRFTERAYSLRLHRPKEGLRISDDLIAWTECPSSALVAALRGRAFMERGNFLRILGDREGAFQSLAQAFELQANGTGDPLEAARYQELLGTLERDCGNFEAAARLLKKALAKTRRWGDPYTLQRVLLATAVNELYRDRFEAAERYLDESLKVKQPDNLFMSYAAVNTILVRYFSGNPHRAYKSLLRVQDGMGQSWLQEFPQAKQMSVLWTEGQILNSLSLNDDAVVRLKRAREFFIQAAQGSRVGQISIEIALGYAARQRHADVRRELALGLQFCSERSALDRHAKEALLLLQRALEHQGRLDVEQIRRIEYRLELLHRAPLKTWGRLPFEGVQI